MFRCSYRELCLEVSVQLSGTSEKFDAVIGDYAEEVWCILSGTVLDVIGDCAEDVWCSYQGLC